MWLTLADDFDSMAALPIACLFGPGKLFTRRHENVMKKQLSTEST
jgi:hypothetical protein